MINVFLRGTTSINQRCKRAIACFSPQISNPMYSYSKHAFACGDVSLYSTMIKYIQPYFKIFKD